MTKTKVKDRFILFHMRKDSAVCQPEYENFLAHTGLTRDRLESVNLFEHINYDVGKLSDYAGFFVGGISDDPSDDLQLDETYYPFISSLDKLLERAIEGSIPAMLSCGGFMLASALLGGQLSASEHLREMDIVPIHLTSKATCDPLFTDFPASFNLVSGHLKSTISLPENTTILASSEKCPIHAFKVDEAPLYAFQGHPEMTPDQLKARVIPYKKKYFDSEESFQRFIQTKADTSFANSLLKRFVDMAVKT